MSSKFFHGSSLLVGDNTVPGVQLSKELKEYIPKILQACRNWGLDFYPTVVQLLNYDEISELAAYGGFPVRFPHWSFGMEYEELQRGYEFGGHKIYEMVVNCLNFSVNVSSARGYIKVSDVKIGDILFSKNGGRRVVAVKKQAKSKVVKIDAFGYFQDTICTPNHKWQVLRGYKPEWVEAKDLVQGDILIAGGKYDNFLGSSPQIIWSKQKVYESTLPNVRWKLSDINPPKHMTVELAELLGICAGDGSSGVSGSENMIAIAVGKKNKQYQLHIQNIFHKVFNKEAAIYEKDSGDTVVLCSKYAVDYFNEIGMKKNVTFESKKVPSIIWESSNEYKAAFLRGIFDTDGHVKTNLQMCSKSFELIKDVQLLLLEIGIFSKVVHVNNKHNNIYVLYILGRSNQLAFSKYVNFSTEYKREALFNLVNSGYAIAHGNKLPNVQKEILRRLEELPNQRKLPAWIKRWKWLSNKKDVGCNTLWSFVSRLMSAGYDGFEDIFETLQSPMYVVEKCAEYGEEETIDIALDHDEHDFLANGLVSHNTNPCYIYNLASNTLADHLTVVAHATGHNDFFKNNIHFSATDTNMLNKMANHSARIRNYMSRWGKERVTEFLDHVMRLETLIDGSEAWTERVVKDRNIRDERRYNKPQLLNVDKQRLYMEPFINTPSFRKRKNEEVHEKDIADEIGFFKEPTKNILGFIRDNAPLKPWQSDIVSMLYEEAIYFFPQRQTKVINEGWSSTVDSVIMAEQGFIGLGQKSEDCGIVEYADHKMGVLGGKYSMNPYKLGFYLLADIRERWDKGRFGTEYDECTDMHKKENWDTGAMLGKEKIFEVRKYYDDLTMIHEFFTEEFCRKQEYFHWKHYPNGEYRIDTRDYKTIKKNLMQRHLNGGLPDIRLMEPNYGGRGVMMLQHFSDGRPLYDPYIGDVLSSIQFIWNNDVILATSNEDGKERIYWQRNNYLDVMDRSKFNKTI